MRKILVGLAALAMLLVMVPAASATEGYCGISWGSLPKDAGTMLPESYLLDVRAGQHACYDRLVFDVQGVPAPGYRVEYVPQVTQDGSGHVVPLRGGAKLQIILRAPAYDSNTGQSTFPSSSPELVDVRGFRTFRQVAGAGSFEGQTTIGLGVRARLPFRVFTLPGPGVGSTKSRVVIDVAHRWS
jgi:hypothetical protein